MTKKTATPDRKPTEDLLQAFLGSFENFVTEISAESAKAAPEGEAQILIRATGESLIGQTNKMTAYVRENAARLSVPQRMELDRFLQVQDGVAFANRGVAVTRQVMKGGILGKLLNWIIQHAQELKKILKEILHFILDLLHIPFPDWFDKLLLILDEFFALLGSLLSEVFGIDFGRAAKQFSDQEVNYLRELAAFEAIRVVRASGRSSAQEES